MAGRSSVLSLALLGLAGWALLCGCGSAFVGGSAPAPSTGLRTATAQRALPPGAEQVAESSISTALAVSAWGMAANIVTVFVPVTFLIVLYLQSERSKREMGIDVDNDPYRV
uniref:Uncharacterized protein n=1 Tax=Alexandrium andersonii TaxID=327968 RepID=A0A6U6VTR1_9DINO|mmetsp:Transcript_84371/g.188409  ORF Transcript_84371/g.188409 Transcript_84371/m.188409 type:complete len:112 (+) Transcript_84371:79-414(+)